MRWPSELRTAKAITLALGTAMLNVLIVSALSQGREQPASSTSLPISVDLAGVASPYRITGIVIDRVTHAPIKNAVLSIAPMTSVRRAAANGNRRARKRRPEIQPETVSATTDSAGRFDLEAPSAGGYELTAAAHGYRTQALDEHDGYSTAVILTDSMPKFEAAFAMTPAATIEGYVLDEAGEPVRDAQVGLSYFPPPAPENQHPRPVLRGQQLTDDRGFYRFSGNGPGSYQVRVSATPWYATSREGRPGEIDTNEANPSNDFSHAVPDPLDLVYPTVWFPGVTDPAAAISIAVRGGERQEASFRLLPVPGFHLSVGKLETTPGKDSNQEAPASAPPPSVTYLTRLMPDGSEEPQQSSTRMDGEGNTDVAGLVPGIYLVHRQIGNQMLGVSTLRVGPNSARTIEFNQAVPETVVTAQVDAAADLDSLQIVFRDTETGRISIAARPPTETGVVPGHLREQIRPQEGQSSGQPDGASPPARPNRTVNLPAGEYEVSLNRSGDLHLSGIEAIGAKVTGRTVTIGGGSPQIVLHVARGLGLVTGIVRFRGNTDPGAMVLLIPASLGDPSGLDLPARDQSNSDGSFELSGLLPGGYILVAIDHGWDVNWSDPSTMRRYLLRGKAVEVKPGSHLNLMIEALSP